MTTQTPASASQSPLTLRSQSPADRAGPIASDPSLAQSLARRPAGHVWVKGERAVLTDADGKEYLDGLSGLWNVTAGHGRRELAEAAARQMETLAYCSGYAGSSNPRRSNWPSVWRRSPIRRSIDSSSRPAEASRTKRPSRSPATTGSSKANRRKPKSSRGNGAITA